MGGRVCSLSNLRHPTEPPCSYDPVEGLTLAADADPMDKIKALEDQIGEQDLTHPLPSFRY